MDLLQSKRIIVGSVALGPYSNYGNRLIAQSTLRLLGLPEDTASFSVFEPIGDELLEFINSHDALVITGCTTLQDAAGHQACFDAQFDRIRIKKVCLGGSFYCDVAAAPSLRIARLYDTPIGARDPWTADYLRRNGVACELIGCPTLLDHAPVSDWQAASKGEILVSTSPEIDPTRLQFLAGQRLRHVQHDPMSTGEELRDFGVFEKARLVVTGRLHAALPAIARGIPVKFYDCWPSAHRDIRFQLLDYLGVDRAGNEDIPYPGAKIESLKHAFRNWLRQVFPD